MTHLMKMSLGVQGWSIEPELLDDIAIEIHHSELFGDTLRIKLIFKTGREALLEAELKDGAGRPFYDALMREITAPSHTVIEHEANESGGEDG
jgi:hypothetical protein